MHLVSKDDGSTPGNIAHEVKKDDYTDTSFEYKKKIDGVWTEY